LKGKQNDVIVLKYRNIEISKTRKLSVVWLFGLSDNIIILLTPVNTSQQKTTRVCGASQETRFARVDSSK
jgi:hypothetical protein